MTTTTTLEAFIQDLEVDFECFEADGVTPLDLSGGNVYLDLTRGGIYPFSISADTETIGQFDWTDQPNGKGKLFVALSTLDPLPVAGYCRYKLTSVTGSGDEEIQALGWMKLKGV